MTHEEMSMTSPLPNPHVGSNTGGFTKKRISLPLNSDQANTRKSDVIKAGDISKIISIDEYVEKADATIGKIVKVERERTRKHEISLRKEIEEKAWEKALNEIQQYQDNQEKYFELIESHCTKIVEDAIHYITEDFDDELKISSTIESIISKTKHQNNATIVVHPSQEQWTAKIAIDNGWGIETNPDVGVDQCELMVMNGCYRSSFTGKLKALFDSLQRDFLSNNTSHEFSL